LLQSRPVTFSCELFPPKAGTDLARADQVVEETAQLRPDFISVTYGASGNTSHNTLRMAHHIVEQNVAALAHLTCVSASKAGIGTTLDALLAAGVQNVLALRGDLPEGETKPADACFQHAVDLVREIKAHGGFCIGGACYPECHPESACQEEDIRFLKEKVEAGCDFLTTQMFFDNNLFYNFLYKIREAGITVPVIPGIMPITAAGQVERAMKLSGSFMPQRFKSLVDKFGTNPAAMKQAGIAYATDQIIDLYANGICNVHVYSMNKPDVAEKIQSNLSSIIA